MPVYFHKEDVSFLFNHQARLKAWIKNVILSEKKKTGTLNFIFCSDEYLIRLNREYFKHNYYTDVITFNQSDNREMISGDIFISIDRIKENARMLQLPIDDELHRVMIHGVLHLLGYEDKTKNGKTKMRAKENGCLRQFERAGK